MLYASHPSTKMKLMNALISEWYALISETWKYGRIESIPWKYFLSAQNLPQLKLLWLGLAVCKAVSEHFVPNKNSHTVDIQLISTWQMTNWASLGSQLSRKLLDVIYIYNLTTKTYSTTCSAGSPWGTVNAFIVILIFVREERLRPGLWTVVIADCKFSSRFALVIDIRWSFNLTLAVTTTESHTGSSSSLG